MSFLKTLSVLFVCGSIEAQTTVAVPSVETDTCASMNCVGEAAAQGSGAKTRYYPPRSWDRIDRGAETGESSEDGTNAQRSKPGPFKDHDQPRSEQAGPESEFQKFVSESTGTHLSIYGSKFFARPLSTFSVPYRPAVPKDYVLAAGDNVLIHVWGQVEINFQGIVDRNGDLYLPKVGVVNVLGVRFDRLHDHLKKVLDRLFRNFELSVSLGKMHSMDVFVVGQARKPGRYNVSALTSLANALLATGGPSSNGSMRRIQLKREGSTITEFDLYDLLLQGDASRDAVLQPGDIIYIPPVGPQVALWGSVNQPAIYELRGETTVQQEIEAAGGLSPTADGSSVLLERVEGQQNRGVEKLGLKEAGGARILRSGDILRVFPISPRFENAVSLLGNVARPGRYPWHAGMHIADLIPSREAIITDEYWTQQNFLSRAGKGWIEKPQPVRRLKEPGSEKPLASSPAEPPVPRNQNEDEGERMGAALTPGKAYGTAPNRGGEGQEETELHAEFPGRSSEINWDYAVVQRMNPSDLSAQLLSFNLGRAIDDAHSPDNLALEPGDVVTVFSQLDVRVPVEKRAKFVWIEGEVRASGVYRVEPGETLRDVVARAGGLTLQAYLFAADFRRESTRRAQQDNLERVLEEMDKELRAKASALAAIPNAEDRQAGKDELDLERGRMEKLRQTRATGRIVLNLKPPDSTVGDLPAIALEDGDHFTIPEKPAVVAVVGSVYNQNSFLYQTGKSLGAYLRQSGGVTRNGDRGQMFVIRADGSVLSNQMQHSLWAGSFQSVRLGPGDTVVVPERIRTGTLLRGIRDWSQVFSQFALGAAAIRVVSP
jgi:protein involved in polysaccharide export with SLBB domain